MGRRERAIVMPSSPSVAVRTVQPSDSNTAFTSSTARGSSSMASSVLSEPGNTFTLVSAATTSSRLTGFTR